MFHSYRWAAALIAVFAFSIPQPLMAQQQDTAELRREAERRLGRSVSQGEILQRLRDSGMTRAQARTRLQQMGYDPGLADSYFDALESGGQAPEGFASQRVLTAMDRLGISVRDLVADSVAAALADSLSGDPLPPEAMLADSLRLDSGRADSLRRDSLEQGLLPIFGQSLFASRPEQFAPLDWGPVDEGYRLGPGDELVLILTGDVELAYDMEVSREGYIVIPDVGQVHAGGLTLAELEDRLYVRLGQAYSGVRRGPEATTRFQVSLGRLRANQIYLVGEVEEPGAYQVSALATVFNALHQAGGPNENGSFRRVQVRRGGALVGTVDLYDYLVDGDSEDDLRLQSGDRVHVPLAGPRVSLRGAVKRPAIYELAEGERLRDLIEYAGGFRAEAVVRRIQVDRILPPEQRRPGVDRVVVDVELEQLLSDAAGVEPRDGDEVEVFAVSEERRNRIWLGGNVRRPGRHEWRRGMTLADALDNAEGLAEDAYRSRVHIFRLNELDGSRQLIRVPLAEGAGESAATEAIALSDRDSVVVYSRSELRVPETVVIEGLVKEPGEYALADGMTLEDLVLSAGGFVHGAHRAEAELARQPDASARTQQLSDVIRVPLGGTATPGKGGDGSAMPAAGAAGELVPDWSPDAAEITLEHGDRVFIRKAPGYEAPRTVHLSGEVEMPGDYVLESRQERLAELIRRAGGTTLEAHVPGSQLRRDGTLVGTNLADAMSNPNSSDNVLLEAGDTIHIPAYDPMVLVTGAVAFESRVPYTPGRGLDYYVEQAGGYTEIADRDRASVTFQNGERDVADGGFLFFGSTPRPGPGSQVFVPAHPSGSAPGFNWDRFLTRSLAVLSTTATLLIAVDRIDRN